jgi:hypothetical protein
MLLFLLRKIWRGTAIAVLQVDIGTFADSAVILRNITFCGIQRRLRASFRSARCFALSKAQKPCMESPGEGLRRSASITKSQDQEVVGVKRKLSCL